MLLLLLLLLLILGNFSVAYPPPPPPQPMLMRHPRLWIVVLHKGLTSQLRLEISVLPLLSACAQVLRRAFARRRHLRAGGAGRGDVHGEENR